MEGSACVVLDVQDVSSMSYTIRKPTVLFPELYSAGVVGNSDFEYMTEQEYDSIKDINAKGAFLMGQVMGNYMIEKEIKEHILNVTSSSALCPAWTPYQMLKWAVRGFTLELTDKLLPHGIVVNTIALESVATEMLNKKKTKNFI